MKKKYGKLIELGELIKKYFKNPWVWGTALFVVTVVLAFFIATRIITGSWIVVISAEIDFSTPALYFFSAVAQTMGALLAITFTVFYVSIQNFYKKDIKREIAERYDDYAKRYLKDIVAIEALNRLLLRDYALRWAVGSGILSILIALIGLLFNLCIHSHISVVFIIILIMALILISCILISLSKTIEFISKRYAFYVNPVSYVNRYLWDIRSFDFDDRKEIFINQMEILLLTDSFSEHELNILEEIYVRTYINKTLKYKNGILNNIIHSVLFDLPKSNDTTINHYYCMCEVFRRFLDQISQPKYGFIMIENTEIIIDILSKIYATSGEVKFSNRYDHIREYSNRIDTQLFEFCNRIHDARSFNFSLAVNILMQSWFQLQIFDRKPPVQLINRIHHVYKNRKTNIPLIDNNPIQEKCLIECMLKLYFMRFLNDVNRSIDTLINNNFMSIYDLTTEDYVHICQTCGYHYYNIKSIIKEYTLESNDKIVSATFSRIDLDHYLRSSIFTIPFIDALNIIFNLELHIYKTMNDEKLARYLKDNTKAIVRYLKTISQSTRSIP